MRHVALLRGINVGGKNKVDMAQLRAAFEAAGLRDVATYLNTGNVVFAGRASAPRLEAVIAEAVGFPIAVLLRSGAELAAVLDGIPPAWVADRDQRCEVIFLGKQDDHPEVVDLLPRNPEVDELAYVPGAVLWHLERSKATRSRVSKMIGTELYGRMSMRSAGTVRKLVELCG
ncbi:MAG: hypothetical protein JWN67_3239 [Actinomycetia bacterium]|nr:hypothetical protein [Actinomycetes bacterium]